MAFCFGLTVLVLHPTLCRERAQAFGMGVEAFAEAFRSLGGPGFRGLGFRVPGGL